jgi:hypothetical protein
VNKASFSFRVAFILGDRAVKAARQSDLPKSMFKIIHDGKLALSKLAS